jgi:GGDEF domain-containing protein
VDLVQGAGKHLITNLEPKVIDKRAIHNVMMSLRRPDTGMFTYPAFLYFLEQEYFRAYRSASPLSVVIFQMRMKSANADDPVREPLSLEALNEAVRRMSRVKRHVDLLAHYETFDYAFLLPNTKGSGVQAFIGRITKAVTAEPLAPGLPRDCVEMTFGSACIPEDTLELSLLLSAAEVAKNAAQHAKSELVFYHELL